MLIASEIHKNKLHHNMILSSVSVYFKPKSECSWTKGPITIRRTPLPTFLVNFFNFRIFIKFFIHEVKKTSKF